jgi:hypothetical protein
MHEKLHALIDARAGEADVVSLRVQVGRIIEVARISSPTWSGVRKRLYQRKDITVIHTGSPILLGNCGQNVGTAWARFTYCRPSRI